MAESRMFHKAFDSLFVVGRNLGQNIPDTAWTIVEWDVEQYDLLDEMAIIANWRFVPKQVGYYLLHSHVTFNDLDVNDICGLYFYLNGVANLAGSTGETALLNEDITLSVDAIRLLDPTDFVDVRVWHNFGAVRQIQGNQWESSFHGYRIR